MDCFCSGQITGVTWSISFVSCQIQLGGPPSFSVRDSFLERTSCHALCPIAVLSSYLEATSQAPQFCLFVRLDSLASCSKQHIAQLVCQVIELADRGHHPTSWDMKWVGSPLTTSVTNLWIMRDKRVSGDLLSLFGIVIYFTLFKMCLALRWGPFLTFAISSLRNDCYSVLVERMHPVLFNAR